MAGSIDVAYLLALVIGTFGLVSLLRYAQKEVLAELKDVLYRQGDPKRYLEMLKSRKLGLVLRKGTLVLLELNAYLYMGDDNGTQDVFGKVDGIRMTKGERLDFYQKKLSFSISSERYEQARETYKAIEHLVEKEPDEKLKAILRDARLMVGIYADRDTALIPQLLSLERKQTGSMQGITRYRLAKLYWFSGNSQKAMEYLALAEPNLRGTDWEPLIKEVQITPDILEKR